MPTRRQKRLNELLLEELSMIIPGRLDDPRLADVAITRVEVTQDLSTAKVYYTCTDTESDCPEAVVALAHSESFLRGELSGVGLRRLPHLVFTRDRFFESGQRVVDLLNRMPPPPPEEVPPDGDDHPQA